MHTTVQNDLNKSVGPHLTFSPSHSKVFWLAYKTFKCDLNLFFYTFPLYVKCPLAPAFWGGLWGVGVMAIFKYSDTKGFPMAAGALWASRVKLIPKWVRSWK